MKKLGIISIGIVIIVVGLVMLAGGHKKPTTTTSSSTNTANTAATITYSDSGFSPALTTVKSGAMVAIKNATSSDMQMDSDPHPVHTDDTDLNVGTVGPGQTATFTVTKKGTFGFHNHLNPTDTAKITIE